MREIVAPTRHRAIESVNKRLRKERKLIGAGEGFAQGGGANQVTHERLSSVA
jgi:hypothetical protein